MLIKDLRQNNLSLVNSQMHLYQQSNAFIPTVKCIYTNCQMHLYQLLRHRLKPFEVMFCVVLKFTLVIHYSFSNILHLLHVSGERYRALRCYWFKVADRIVLHKLLITVITCKSLNQQVYVINRHTWPNLRGTMRQYCYD